MEPIVIKQSFARSSEDVWGAITQIEQMPKWFFAEIEAFQPEVGFVTEFCVVLPDQKKFAHRWEITQVIAGRKIVYAWSYPDYEGSSEVTFELFTQGEQTELVLTHAGLENFPEDVPELSRESGLMGWRYFIQDSLKKYLG